MQQGHWQLPADARVLIASDMHIGEHDPDTASFFLRALAGHASSCTHLVLLGDLFEAWPGDDQQDPVASRLVTELASLVSRGTTVAVMRGNRDFLLDVPLTGTNARSFSACTGVTMLADTCVMRVDSLCCLLMHGDSLCTDDVQYQQVRQLCRSDAWQQEFLSHSLDKRVEQARQYRRDSKQTHREKQEQVASGGADITDVAQAAVNQALLAADCNVLIHGHTHRPAVHCWQLAGQEKQRYVLPDWHAGCAQTPARGGFLRVTRSGIETLGCTKLPAAN